MQRDNQRISDNTQKVGNVPNNNSRNGAYFVAPGTTLGYLYDSNGMRYAIGVFNVSGNGEYNAYCIDNSVYLKTDEPYREATDEEITTIFPSESVNKIRKILNMSYPFIQDLDYLSQESGVANLTVNEVVVATQAAIWAVICPETFQLSYTTNPERIINLYNYFIDNSQIGWELYDVEMIGASIMTSINLDNVEQSRVNDNYSYGPFSLSYNSMFADHSVYNLQEDDYMQFSDEYGNDISSVTSDDEFFFNIPANITFDNININACGTVNYGVDVKPLIAEGGTDVSQSCIMVAPLYKEICATYLFCLASLVVHKIIDGDYQQPLKDVVLELYNSSNELIATGSTDESGTITFYDLMPEKYTIKEVTVPDGYSIINEPFAVDVECPLTELTIENFRTPGRIKVIKYNKNDPDTMLAGAEFDVYDENYNLVGHIICDENGIGISDELKSGVYYLIETKSPEGFIMDSSPIKVNLNTGEEITKVVYICNKQEAPKGFIEIMKVDECCSDISVADAEFNIVDYKGELVDYITTAENGKAVSKPLAYGYYTITEVKAPMGYQILGNPVYVNLNQEVAVINVTNQKLPFTPVGRFKINKHDALCESLMLGGAEFDVFDSYGNKVGIITTVSDEYAYSNELPFGTYIIVETKAPEGYIPNPNPIYVTINSSNYIKTVNIANDRPTNHNPKSILKIIAFNEECIHVRVEGGEFNVYDKDNMLVTTLITNQYGEAYTQLIPLGEYKIVNVGVPSEMQTVETPIFISLESEDYIAICEILFKMKI